MISLFINSHTDIPVLLFNGQWLKVSMYTLFPHTQLFFLTSLILNNWYYVIRPIRFPSRPSWEKSSLAITNLVCFIFGRIYCDLLNNIFFFTSPTVLYFIALTCLIALSPFLILSSAVIQHNITVKDFVSHIYCGHIRLVVKMKCNVYFQRPMIKGCPISFSTRPSW